MNTSAACRRGQVKTFLLIVCILFGCAVIGLITYRLREPRLLERATRVIALTKLAKQYDQWNGQAYYQWLSSNEVLVYSNSASRQTEWQRYNVKTGKTQNLGLLSRHFNAANSADTWARLSPNGKWLVWQGDSPKISDTGRWYASTLDGSHFMHWPLQVGSVDWSIDGRKWFSFPGNLVVPLTIQSKSGSKAVRQPDPRIYAYQYRIDPPGPATRLSISEDSPLSAYPSGLDQYPISGPICVLNDRYVLMAPTGGFNPEGEALIREVDLGEQGTQVHEYRAAIPVHAQVLNCAFSPQGDRVVWKLYEERVDPVRAAMHRFLYTVKITKQTAVSLWVSRTNGTQLHELGYMPVNPDDGLLNVGPNELGWLPDGKQISFEYNNSLWTVPAN